MYPKHVGHENGGCGHLGRAPLSPPTFGGHSCKKDCMVAPHESVLIECLSQLWRRRRAQRSKFDSRRERGTEYHTPRGPEAVPKLQPPVGRSWETQPHAAVLPMLTTSRLGMGHRNPPLAQVVNHRQTATRWRGGQRLPRSRKS